MTNLEKSCANALRLSDSSANALITSIQDNIEIAQANMIRLGISNVAAKDEEDKLVCNVIVKYVVSQMATVESERIRAYEIYRVCLDELRKTQGYVK